MREGSGSRLAKGQTRGEKGTDMSLAGPQAAESDRNST